MQEKIESMILILQQRNDLLTRWKDVVKDIRARNWDKLSGEDLLILQDIQKEMLDWVKSNKQSIYNYGLVRDEEERKKV
jgi:hypothetical protein